MSSRKQDKAPYEIPALAWNDKLTGVQVASTLSGRLVIRVDSLPKAVDKDAIASFIPSYDATWADLATIKEALVAMLSRDKIAADDIEPTLSAISDTLARFFRLLPRQKWMLTEKQLMQRAEKMRFDPYELKKDLEKLETAGKVFFDVLSLPVVKRFDERDALRRLMSERKLIREANSKEALARRLKELPASIEAASESLAQSREKLAALSRKVAKKDALLSRLMSEKEEILAKLSLMEGNRKNEP